MVNNHPLTKNKLIYHARISKQMKWQGSFSPVYVPSVINWFIFGQAVVIYFIMQLLLKKSSKKQPHVLPSEEIHFPPSCLFCQQLQDHSVTESRNIHAKTMHFVVK